MQIKTIAFRLNNAKEFDEEINQVLSEGWFLDRRFTIRGVDYTMLVAELSKLDENDIIQPVEAETITQPLNVEVCLDTEELTKRFRDILNEVTTETIKIKYFDQEIEKIQKISVGDWIDLRSAETVELKQGEYKLLRLGVGMILPDGYEALVVPRSSTPNKFGIMLANSVGVIDNSYSGDSDEWRFPAVAIRDTVIHKGDRICQFRIVKNQPAINFEIVDHLNDVSRGGIGSTGER